MTWKCFNDHVKHVGSVLCHVCPHLPPVTGPPLPKIKFVVAVNWTGVLFMDGRDKKLQEFPYIEIKDVNIERH